MFYYECRQPEKLCLVVLFDSDENYDSFKPKLKKFLSTFELAQVYVHVALISSRGPPASLSKRINADEIIDALFNRFTLFYNSFKDFYNIKVGFEQFLYEELTEGGLIFTISYNLYGTHELCKNFTQDYFVLIKELRNQILNNNICMLKIFNE